jgi:hypothetical protein
MKNWLSFFLAFALLACSEKTYDQTFVTTDIANYWNAYDKIIGTEDTLLQLKYLKTDYLDKGTEGLQALMEVRRYTPEELLENIKKYPKFWASIRPTTTDINNQYDGIRSSIASLKDLYPDLKPVPIYFAIGGFRTNGTIKDQKVLIGSEMALANSTTESSELPEHLHEFYNEYKPLENLDLLCAHEYIHTQQKEVIYNLLSTCIYEGVPEFVATLATGKPSYLPAIAFGENNYEQVRNKFEEDLFITYRRNNWMWSSSQIFGYRDLGYAVGYSMAKKYYERATDKAQAIKAMIELDFQNDVEVEAFVDESGYLSKPINQLYDEYQAARPYVTHTSGIENGSKDIPAGQKEITIHFSEPLNGYNTGVDYGEKGAEAFPKVSFDRIWSDDNQSWTITADLESNKHYQILISNNFRLENGIQLKPYLIEFWTAE